MNKRTFCYLIPILLLLAGLLPADEGRRRDDRSDGMAQRGAAQALDQRTFNVLAINKLGQYVSNMGQFYSSWNELSPTAEWPLGSGHEAMWRMNLYIGTPGNVVQTRTFGTKEWDPVDGYQNPEVGLTAVSNDTATGRATAKAIPTGRCATRTATTGSAPARIPMPYSATAPITSPSRIPPGA